MKSENAQKNIRASFEANPKVDKFYANEHGHCFTASAEGLVEVNRSEYEKVKKAAKEASGAGDESTEAATDKEGSKTSKKK